MAQRLKALAAQVPRHEFDPSNLLKGEGEEPTL